MALTPQEIVEINAFMQDVLDQLEPLQRDYYQEYERNWQGLCTHDVPPSVPTKPNLNVKPYYQDETWLDIGLVLPELFRASLEVLPMETPGGNGFVLYARAKDAGGVSWVRGIAKGIIDGYDLDWTEDLS